MSGMARCSWGAARLLLPMFLFCASAGCLFCASAGFAQEGDEPTEPEWLLQSLKEARVIDGGEALVVRHLRGDVRVQATDTDRVQVTVLAQYRSDDPRLPEIRWEDARLTVDFAALEIAESEAWAKRRIDLGLLVPRELELRIETGDGLIAMKDLTAPVELFSKHGEITYKGTGELTARSEHGRIRAVLRETEEGQSIALSSLTGDIQCTFLEGADAQIELRTRGPITTDYSIEIDREVGSPLKKGRVRLGEGGAVVRLESENGGLRVQGLIVPENPDL